MSRESIVAYFDILGYQSYLKNNSAIETAENVFKVVKEAPKQAVENLGNSEHFKNDKEISTTITSIKSLVFSDTIVVSCPIPESGIHEKHVSLIAATALGITKSMFSNGLPVRGVITFGSFIFDEACVAGRAVVDAYTLCQMLDLAGTAFAPKLNEYIDKTFSIHRNFWDELFPYYLFPLKDQSELRARAISWIGVKGEDNFTTEVREAFWKWNKDIPRSVDSKVHNTAKMLDFFKIHFQNAAEAKKKSITPSTASVNQLKK
jgi:hypothetical protein